MATIKQLNEMRQIAGLPPLSKKQEVALKEAFSTNRPYSERREEQQLAAREKIGYNHVGTLRNVEIEDINNSSDTYVFDDEGEVIYIIPGNYSSSQIRQYVENAVGKKVADAYYDSYAALEVITKEELLNNYNEWANIETETFPIELLPKIVRRWAVRNGLSNDLPSMRRK